MILGTLPSLPEQQTFPKENVVERVKKILESQQPPAEFTEEEKDDFRNDPLFKGLFPPKQQEKQQENQQMSETQQEQQQDIPMDDISMEDISMEIEVESKEESEEIKNMMTEMEQINKKSGET